jgi:hypothetical protein
MTILGSQVMSTNTFQAISLGQNELKQRVTLTNEATEILKATCKAGQLHFDLYDPKAFLTNKAIERTMDCETPGKENQQ